MGRRHLQLCHAWGSHPLLDTGDGDRVDPADLPLPDSLVYRLEAWATRWDTTFDVADPDQPRVDAWVVDDLAHEGARLYRALCSVLPHQSYALSYVHGDVVYREPGELPAHWRVE